MARRLFGTRACPGSSDALVIPRDEALLACPHYWGKSVPRHVGAKQRHPVADGAPWLSGWMSGSLWENHRCPQAIPTDFFATMLIGSGLLAKAFLSAFSEREDVCIYAAGVSNSTCVDIHEFVRERQRLVNALRLARHADVFVYFGTCSVDDPETNHAPYVVHKLAMEQLTCAHPRHLILRLPQVAGKTPNPHTLLNFLHARIARSEAFSLWKNAKRNIIDVDDIVAMTSILIADQAARSIRLNMANPVSYPMADIVAAMENVIGKRAIYDVVERGSAYAIDTCATLPVMEKAPVDFGDGYLEQVINKYYGKYD